MALEDGTIGDIMDAIETVLKADLGDFDFSVAGRFGRGRYRTPPKVPFCAVANPAIESPQGPPLGMHEQLCKVLVMAWAPSGGTNLDARTRTSLALLHQLKKALDHARRTPGGAIYAGGLRTWQYEGLTLDGELDEIEPSQACAELVITFSYVTQEGL